MADDTDNVIPIGSKPPRTAKQQAAIDKRKAANPRPAAGNTADNPASGIPAMGAGWGGPKKGAGSTVPLAGGPFHTREAIANKAAEADAMLAILADIARDTSTNPQVRVNAALGALERIEGKAVTRTMPNTTDTVEELRSRDPIEAARTYQRIVSGK